MSYGQSVYQSDVVKKTVSPSTPSIREKKNDPPSSKGKKWRSGKQNSSSTREKKGQPSLREKKSTKPPRYNRSPSTREKRTTQAGMVEISQSEVEPVPVPLPSTMLNENEALANATPDERNDVPPAFDVEYGSMEQGVIAFLDDTARKGLDGVYAEYAELRLWKPLPCKTDCFDKYDKLNRYRDIVCIEWSRVRLERWALPTPPPVDVTDDGDSIAPNRESAGDDYEADGAPFTMGLIVPTRLCEDDYIHANNVDDWWMGKSSLPVSFICTQGPLPNTIGDFWRMCWFNKVPCIIMLCDFVEMGKNKCAKYYPTKKGESIVYGNVEVTCHHGETLFPYQAGTDDAIMHTLLSIQHVVTRERHRIRHFKWTSWPDKAVPTTSAAVVVMAKHAVKHYPDMGRVVIHCSAGIGRTGTLVALTLCIQRFNNKRPVDMPYMLKLIRQQRVHSIQTATQYAFCYRSIIHFLATDPDTKRIVRNHVGAQKFISDYNAMAVGTKPPPQVQLPQPQPAKPLAELPVQQPSQKPTSVQPQSPAPQEPIQQKPLQQPPKFQPQPPVQQVTVPKPAAAETTEGNVADK